MKIETKSPTRVDLAGGTLDLWPIHFLLRSRRTPWVESCLTVNITVDIFSRVVLEPVESLEVQVDISDLNYKRKFSTLADFLACGDREMALALEVARYFKLERGFKLHTSSDSPVGGGIGGSSSMCISLIKAFSKFKKQTLDLHQTVKLASSLEAAVLHTPTGTQDYFAAANPGLNIIHYEPAGTVVENISFDHKTFTDYMLLIDTGKSHHSGMNNWQVFKATVEKNKETLDLLEELARVSFEVATACRMQDWERLPGLFAQEYAARSKLAPSFISPEIERLNAIAKEAGALGVKICGAGGGGCVMVWVRPELRSKLKEICQKNAFRVLDVQPVSH